MKFCLRILFLLFLVSGTLTQDGFDLSDALGPSPTEAPKPPPKDPEKPKIHDGDLDLLDAFGDDLTPTKKPEKPKKPSSGGFDLDLEDALGPDPHPKTEKPAVKPPKSGGGGGDLGDLDLVDVAGGDYKPDGGRSGGRAQDFDNNQGGADQPQEAGSGQIAGIVSAIGVALLGAASSYFAYQKKKLCFKLQGGQDPEMGKGQQGTQSDPQVLSNLLRTQ